MANYTWKSNSGSADWSSTTNWTIAGSYPGQSGPATDSALLKVPSSAGASYTVTYDPTAKSYSPVVLNNLTLGGFASRTTTLTLSGSDTMTVDNTITIGNSNSTTGSAILGTGTLQAGGGGLVSLTTNDSSGLLNTTGALAGTGLGSSVVLADDNTAGTVLSLGGVVAGASIGNAFSFADPAVIPGATFSISETSATSLDYTGTISGMNVGSSATSVANLEYLNVQTPNAPITNVTWSGSTITLLDGSSTIGTVTLAAAVPGGDFVDWLSDSSATGQTGGQVGLGGTDIFLSSVVCFAAGTRILTADGERAIEDLAEGDLVVTLAGSDRALQPVKWIGTRRVDLAAHPRRALVAPVRVRRGAFGDNMPSRDLAVSPDHALFVDGKLVVARLLLNGMTITQDLDARAVEYYHVELPRHAVLLAEGLPAESYLDTGNRAMFSNAGLALVLHPDFGISHGVSTWQDDGCAPLVTTVAQVEPIWRQLAARAEALGYAAPNVATTTDPDLHVMVDGMRLRPLASENGRYVFVLPAGAESIRLASRASAPAEVAAYLEDRRRLGVAVGRLAFRAGGEVREIPVDHPMLARGWHAAEREGIELRRWTDGDAHLSVPFAPGAGLVTLEVQTSCQATYRAEQASMDQRLAA